ncbi:hypothetical protein [Sorangium sp. So ce233]|uniref:hypothetical protein n=1 Tax=Sorangium sp. So ce233 TaxID=3133290 RepID=UPI003F609B55
MLIQLIADLYSTTPTPAQLLVRDEFTKNPDRIMEAYRLTQEQKAAIGSRDRAQIEAAVVAEIAALQGRVTDPNW